MACNHNIARAVRFIDKNMAKPLTLTELSRECGMSKYHFARTFKSVTGVTFKTYHNEKRMEAARDLLENQEMRITDICFSLGFNDASYFSRVFRQREGLSPSAYKNKFKI